MGKEKGGREKDGREHAVEEARWEGWEGVHHECIK